MIKPTLLRPLAIAALLSGSCFSAAAAPPAPPVSYGVEEDVFHPVRAKQGMVASVDATATQVGVDILKEGGNAAREVRDHSDARTIMSIRKLWVDMPVMPPWRWATRWR